MSNSTDDSGISVTADASGTLNYTYSITNQPMSPSITSGSIISGGSFGSTSASSPINISKSSVSLTKNCFPAMTVNFVNDDFVISFHEHTNGAKIKAVLSPEHSITAIEQLKISTLMTMITVTAANLNITPISYIRKNNLERHFSFSQE